MSVAICLVCGLVYILVEHFGALAQLVARFHGMEEVRGSNPLCSTSGFTASIRQNTPYTRPTACP